MKAVMQLAVDAGILQLSNGAEVWRVESTIEHICRAFEIENVDVYVLSNAIFITGNNEEDDAYAKVKYIPLSGVHMGIVAAVNDLSREIFEGKYTLDEAVEKLERIKHMKANDVYLRAVASGIGSAAFIYILGANMIESFIAGVIGIAVYLFSVIVSKQKLSKLVKNMLGGAFVAFAAFSIAQIPALVSIDIGKIVIGGIMPLIPGVAFVNSIRDIANTDFLSGTIRMLDTIMVFIYLAVGASFVLAVGNAFIGGNLWM